MSIDDAQLEDFPTLAKARSLWDRGRLDAALAAFDAALREQPHNVKALLEAARAFGGRHEIARAETLLDRARAIGGADKRIAPVIAQSYGRIFRPARAIALLEAMDETPAPITAELATLYEQAGRLDDALATIEKCIAAAPSAAPPQAVRGRILRRMGRNERAKAVLRPLTRSQDALARAETWTELSYLLEAEGDPDAAADAIERAHDIARRSPGAAQLAARARANNAALGALAADFDATAVARWRTPPYECDPRVRGVAHLIGFPRSGTTLLEQRLDAHPDLADSPERVIFARDVFPTLCRAGGGALSLASLDAAPRSLIVAERRRYFDYMEAALGEPLRGRLHLDKNPNHTSLLPGLVRLLPESRFVVALRDPRDVVTSCVMRSFALTEFSAMLLDWRSACELYAFEMGTWLRHREALDPADWFELRYEDLVDDAATATNEALAFLDLTEIDDIASRNDHLREKVVNSPSQSEARKPIYRRSIGRWRDHRRRLEPHLHLLAPFIRAFGYD